MINGYDMTLLGNREKFDKNSEKFGGLEKNSAKDLEGKLWEKRLENTEKFKQSLKSCGKNFLAQKKV